MFKSALQYSLLSALALIFIVSCTNQNYRKLSKYYGNFTPSEIELILEGDTEGAMRVWKIDSESDSLLLRTKCTSISYKADDMVLHTFMDRLYKTVIDSVNAGVGIAAPQVGILKNMIWVQRFDKIDYPFEVYLNPIITYYSEEKQPCMEGCLSIPGRMDTTYTRAQTIEINYLDSLGTERNESVDGFTAVIFQHEIDHLNGILYLDHLKE